MPAKKNHDDQEDLRKGWIQSLAKVGALSFEMAVPLGLGFFLGEWADKKLQVFPLCTALGCLLGFAVCALRIGKLTRQKWK
jgi:hypothetical protein